MEAYNGRTGVTADTLAEAAEQLPVPELERLVDRLLVLRARKVAHVLSVEESALLARIYRDLPDDVRRRYGELITKRRAEQLTPEEHTELLSLTERAEKQQGERLKALSELAQLRNVSLRELTETLGIKPPPVE